MVSCLNCTPLPTPDGLYLLDDGQGGFTEVPQTLLESLQRVEDMYWLSADKVEEELSWR